MFHVESDYICEEVRSKQYFQCYKALCINSLRNMLFLLSVHNEFNTAKTCVHDIILQPLPFLRLFSVMLIFTPSAIVLV